MAANRKKLGEILVDWKVITPKEVDAGLARAKKDRSRIGEALIELKLCTDANIYKALAAQQNMEYVDLTKESIPPNAFSLIPDEMVRKHLILPLGIENGKLRVALHDPLDMELQDVLRFRLGKDIRPVLAPKAKIKSVIDDLGAKKSATTTIDQTEDRTVDRFMESLDKSMDRSLDRSVDRSVDSSVDEKSVGDDIENDPSQAPIIKLSQALIAEAVRGRASDIHIEPMKEFVRVRYRIDGECVERDKIPLRMRGPLISRIKIMAGIDIAEKRLPQDGRIKLSVDGQQIDFRVSTLPAYHGESTVLRILRPENVRIGLENLGFESEDFKTFQKIIKRPNGIFLVTGPTGSGKTTSLYAALNVLNRPDHKIITAEDPVEYNIPGINQVQIREKINLTFARTLRAMLRQAPNTILVGEIRDKEVADVAIQAALTGHLVFSTLHTNDAPSALTRLIDMGVKPFLVASSIQAVMAQRLVRVLCEKCKQPDNDPNWDWLRLAGFKKEDLEGQTMYKPRGCDHCNGIGFRGRQAIFEMLQMNNELRTLAFDRAPTNKFRKAAVKSGMKSLLADGRIKVLRGLTTAEEIVKVAQVEGIVTDNINPEAAD